MTRGAQNTPMPNDQLDCHDCFVKCEEISTCNHSCFLLLGFTETIARGLTTPSLSTSINMQQHFYRWVVELITVVRLAL